MIKIQGLEDIFQKITEIIPKLHSCKYKGQNGKIAVIGGCQEYTGAPYYSAISAVKGGADLSHIFCTKSASTPIKCYSPELIVHPTLLATDEVSQKIHESEQLIRINECIQQTKKWYPSMNSVIIGPGLGRDYYISKYISSFIDNKQGQKLNYVFDADFFWYLCGGGTEVENFPIETSNQLFELIRSNSKYCCLTPNIVEFERIWAKYLPNEKSTNKGDITTEKKALFKFPQAQIIQLELDNVIVKDCVKLSQTFNNATIFLKGEHDIITDGKLAFITNERGAMKRCGGQGDILSGLIAVYQFWSQYYFLEFKSFGLEQLAGAIMASLTTKRAGRNAFNKEKFSLTAPQIISEISLAFNELFGNEYYTKAKI